MKLPVVLTCLLFCSFTWSKAQDIDAILARIEQQLPLRDTTSGAADLFLHTDKTVYAHTDEIWFTAYLLQATDISQYHTLYVALINDMTQQPVFMGRYVLEGGAGSGNMPVPDSLQAGEYSLIAYTNRLLELRHGPVFRQSIHLLGGGKAPYQLGFARRTGDAPDSLYLTAKITRGAGGLAASTTGHYTLYADGLQIAQMPFRTDAFGELPIAVPLAMEDRQLEIRGQVATANRSMPFKQVVTWESTAAICRFNREEALISGFPARVGVSLRTTKHQAIATRVVVLKNGDSLTSFLTDRHGNGSFVFTPLKGNVYTVKLDEPGINGVSGSFPAVLAGGYGLHVRETVVNDSLVIDATVPVPGRKILLVAHDQRNLIFNVLIALPGGRGTFKVSTADWPAGLTNLNLYDEQGVLQQTYTVMVQRKATHTVTLVPDSSVYHKGGMVTVHIAIKDQRGQPVKAAFSFAAGAVKTLGSRATNIVRYQEVDLRKGEVLKQGAIVPPGPLRSGYVTYAGRQLKKPVDLLLAAAVPTLVATDAAGRFDLPVEALRGPPHSKQLLSLVSQHPLLYEVLLDSTAWAVFQALARRYYQLPAGQQDEMTVEEKDRLRLAQGKLLEEVTVTNKATRDEYFGNMNEQGYCDDYVCRLGFLNCRIHPKGAEGTTIPIEGERYAVEGVMGTKGPVVYHCAYKGRPKHIQMVNATWYTGTFYDLDPQADNPPELLNRTTLYWAPLLITNDKGEATVSFHTNQLAGRFLCTVQGVTNAGVMHQEVEIMVR